MISPRNRRKSWRYRIQLITISSLSLYNILFPQNVVAGEKPDKNISQNLDLEVQKEVIYQPFPEIPDREVRYTTTVPVTAYSSTPEQTSGNPFITASGAHVADGTIAANFLAFGTKVRFPEYSGDKIYTVQDRMSSRYWERADIWFANTWEARRFGVRNLTIEILN